MKFSLLVGLVLSPLALGTPLEERAQPPCASRISKAEATSVRMALRSAGVVPTLVPKVLYKSLVTVTYGDIDINLGTVTTTSETLQEPAVSFTKPIRNPAGTTYSLFLIDPDVPGPDGLPQIGQPRINFLHWYVANIPACGSPSDGNLISAYEPPTPLSPGQQHRYTFLVYKEPVGYQANAIGAQVRPTFDIQGYASQGGLGRPIGANFFNQSITNGVDLPNLPL